jgi:hypothetical protein
VRAEHSKITGWLCGTLRTEHGNHAGLVPDICAAIMNPSTTTVDDRVADLADADAAVVVPTDREHRRKPDKLRNHRSQVAQFGRVIDEVASEEYRIRVATAHGVYELSREAVGSSAAQVNIADIHQTTGVGTQGDPLFTNVQRGVEPNFQGPEKQGRDSSGALGVYRERPIRC